MGRGISKAKSGGGGGGGGARNARQGSGGSAQSLPSLEGTGSTKQVQWANDIRSEAFTNLNLLNDYYDRQKSQGLSDNAIGFTKQDVAQVRKTLAQSLSDPRAASARFVIDHRAEMSGRSLREMVERVARQRKRK